MNLATDTTDVIQHMTTTLLLGLGAWVAGRAVDRTIGSRGMAVRLTVNGLLVYALFMLFPWRVMSHFQQTFPGVIACAAFFNSQRWDSDKLV